MYDQNGVYWDQPWYYDTYQFMTNHPALMMVSLTLMFIFSSLLLITRKA